MNHYTAAQAHAAHKRGEMTDEQFYIWLAMHAGPPESNWRKLIYEAAGRTGENRLSRNDIEKLWRTKGGTEDENTNAND